MALAELVGATYMAVIGSENVRYQTQPAAAVGITIADDAAWDEIFDSTIVTVDYWICGLQAIILDVAADAGLMVDVGTGGANGAAVAPATTVITNYPIFEDYHQVTAVGVRGGRIPVEWLPFPIRVPASTRCAARIASSPTGTDVIDQFYLVLATAVGT